MSHIDGVTLDELEAIEVGPRKKKVDDRQYADMPLAIGIPVVLLQMLFMPLFVGAIWMDQIKDAVLGSLRHAIPYSYEFLMVLSALAFMTLVRFHPIGKQTPNWIYAPLSFIHKTAMIPTMLIAALLKILILPVWAIYVLFIIIGSQGDIIGAFTDPTLTFFWVITVFFVIVAISTQGE